MSIPYESTIPGKNSDFAQIRDSFYILTTMNQYSMKARASLKKEAEGLLRIVLFSKDLKMRNIDKSLVEFLPEARRELAKELREGRRRGAVPVFISTGWFLFSLGISIQSGMSCVSIFNVFQRSETFQLSRCCIGCYLVRTRSIDKGFLMLYCAYRSLCIGLLSWFGKFLALWEYTDSA